MTKPTKGYAALGIHAYIHYSLLLIFASAVSPLKYSPQFVFCHASIYVHVLILSSLCINISHLSKYQLSHLDAIILLISPAPIYFLI